MKRLNILLLAVFLTGSSPMFGAVRLPAILASGMVLQRDADVKIWGRADPGEQITVVPSWTAAANPVTADPQGRWMVMLHTGAAGGPHTITITGKNRIVLKDILFGEVWLCSGQSNMEFPLAWLGGWKNYRKEKAELKALRHPPIRLCTVAHVTDTVPAEDCMAEWKEASPRSVENFSATAWFYGIELYRRLNVPVGLIVSAIGGTPAEAWTDRPSLEADPALHYFLAQPNLHHDFCRVSGLWNAMVHPLIQYRIRGAIWYQGESNCHQADLYGRLFTTMIRQWRDAWAQGDFPFWFVQIAPYNYHEQWNSAAYLREAQQAALDLPNTGMAVTMDIGNNTDIHPKNKQDVGRRLALLAMNKTYGSPETECHGPEFSGMTIDHDRVRICFDHAEGGLTSGDHAPQWFTVAGGDLEFYPAEAAIDGNCVTVSSSNVKAPAFVRFAFSDTASVNLFNRAGLPAVPFRSDTLPLVIRPVDWTVNADPETKTFMIRMKCPDPQCEIRYTLDGTDPVAESGLYTAPVRIGRTVNLAARAFRGPVASPLILRSGVCLHDGVDKQVTVVNPCAKRYSGGKNALADGIRGDAGQFTARWQGYRGTDLDATVDLGEEMPVSDISAGFLRNTGSWIFLPKAVTFSISSDNIHFTELATVIPEEAGQKGANMVQDYGWKPAQDMAGREGALPVARYVRIVAKNEGKCPKWHPGKGDDAWLFVDEIMINR